jgi:formylglycine-generating enzyme required for sulfatase activity
LGKWLNHDLVGNVAEWAWDRYSTCYSTPGECNDCGVTAGSDEKVINGGAFYSDLDPGLRADASTGLTDVQVDPGVGFRCARQLD